MLQQALRADRACVLGTVPDHEFPLKHKVAYPCDKTVEDVINLWKAQEKPEEITPGFSTGVQK